MKTLLRSCILIIGILAYVGGLAASVAAPSAGLASICAATVLLIATLVTALS